MSKDISQISGLGHWVNDSVINRRIQQEVLVQNKIVWSCISGLGSIKFQEGQVLELKPEIEVHSFIQYSSIS